MPLEYDFITVKIEGLPELARELKQLPREIEGKIIGAGLKTAANIVRDQARANVPVDTGLTKRSIVSWRRRGSKPDNMTYQVGVTLKKRGYRRLSSGRARGGITKKVSAYYWRFVEFGTVKMSAIPFLRPAFDSMVGTALGHFKEVVRRGIKIAMSKMSFIREG